jgi:hypothetical protein
MIPVLPADYPQTLRGALVEVSFTLTHKLLSFKNKPKTSHFVATVDTIIVLEKSSIASSVSPSKERYRSFYLKTPVDEAPVAAVADSESASSSKAKPVLQAAQESTSTGADDHDVDLDFELVDEATAGPITTSAGASSSRATAGRSPFKRAASNKRSRKD